MFITDDMSDHDIEQWLSGGYFRTADEAGPFRFQCVMDDGDRVACVDNSGEEHTFRSGDVDTYWPQCGALNTTERVAIYAERRQSRQWRTTFNTREVRTSVPDEWEIIKAGGRWQVEEAQNGWRVAQAAFRPRYPSVGSALRSLNEGLRYSVAITPTLIVAGKGEHRVYNRTRLVARIVGNKIVPTVSVEAARRLTKVFGGYDCE